MAIPDVPRLIEFNLDPPYDHVVRIKTSFEAMKATCDRVAKQLADYQHATFEAADWRGQLHVDDYRLQGRRELRYLAAFRCARRLDETLEHEISYLRPPLLEVRSEIHKMSKWDIAWQDLQDFQINLLLLSTCREECEAALKAIRANVELPDPETLIKSVDTDPQRKYTSATRINWLLHSIGRAFEFGAFWWFNRSHWENEVPKSSYHPSTSG